MKVGESCRGLGLKLLLKPADFYACRSTGLNWVWGSGFVGLTFTVGVYGPGSPASTLGFGVDVQGLRFRVSNLGFGHWDDPLNHKP